jgi:phage terminase Nu1 subunit (DNA packaging protein)
MAIPSAKKKLLTRHELAAQFAVTPMTITRWQADGMPVARKRPRGQATLFDPVAVEKWRAEVEAQKQAGPVVEGDALSLEVERAKYTRRQREKVELELAVRRGDLVLRDQVVREGLAFVKGWTAKVRSLPRRARLAGIIAADQVQAMEALCRDLLVEIARWKTVADATPAKAGGHPRRERRT